MIINSKQNSYFLKEALALLFLELLKSVVLLYWLAIEW